MINYGDSNIYVGYIKQLLSSFNNPDLDVYSNKIIPQEGNLYIDKDYIVKYKDGKLEKEFAYTFNKSILNITKSFVNTSLTYDNHTHIWLGNYLRYIRDYKKLNLMSMYNCFVDSIPDSLDISNKVMNYYFNAEDPAYKIYMIPIKLFQTYSIYIDSSSTIEFICDLYGEGKEENASFRNLTYVKKGASSFSKPIIFDKLSKKSLEDNNINIDNLYAHRSDLKLFLKINKTNTSSIVILEGDYSSWNDFTITTNNTVSSMSYNNTVSNYEYINEGDINTNLSCPLELVNINSGVNHPFASRLIEYLSDNAITPLDTISDNIKRVQKLLVERKKAGKIGIDNCIYNNVNNYGTWIPYMRNVLYDIAVANNLINTKKDILGYVDKDVEMKIGKDIDIYGGHDL